MIARLEIAGPDVAALINFFTDVYGWAFRDFSQTSTQSGFAHGWHPNPENFLGIGISDGTYVRDVILLNDLPDE